MSTKILVRLLPGQWRPLCLSLDKVSGRYRSLVGNKAANLAFLLRKGYPVPAGFCLTSRAFQYFLLSQGLADRIKALVSELGRGLELSTGLAEIRRLIVETELPADLAESIREACQRLFGPGSCPGPLVVRSSAIQEDSLTEASAGLYDTYLNISIEEVGIYVRRCWSSLWNERAYFYRGRVQQRKPDEALMAVIIQPLVEAESAGVVFTAHPVTGNRDEVVINAGWGLGGPIVTGKLQPDQYLVGLLSPRFGGLVIKDRSIAKKVHSWRPQEGGIGPVIVSPEMQERPVLTEQQIFELAHLSLEVEKAFGHPQDIEWAWREGRFYLLQSRPITSLEKGGPGGDPPILWSRANLKEVLPELPSPFTVSWVQEALNDMWRQHYRRIGYRLPRDFRLVKVFAGRPYFNLSLLQQLSLELGSHPLSLIRFLGGPAFWVPEGSRPPFIWKKMLRRLPTIWRLVRLFQRLPQLASQHFDQIRHRAEQGFDLTKASEGEILDHLTRLEKYLKDHDLTLAIASAAISSHNLLEWLLGNWLGLPAQELMGRLLVGLGDVISAQQGLDLLDLAWKARQDTVARDFFSAPDYDPAEYKDRLKGTRFLADLLAFLRQYGHRGIYETDPMYPRFSEDPSYLLDTIRAYLQGGSLLHPLEIRQRQESLRHQALREIEQAISEKGWPWRPLIRRVFYRAYRELGMYLSLRERNRHYLMMSLQVFRRALLELAPRFVKMGVLERPVDIFFLTVEEVRGLLGGETPPASYPRLRAEVDRRKEEREELARISVPDQVWERSGKIESTLQGWDLSQGGRVLQGLGVSPGLVTGRVRLLSHPDQKSLKKGEIVVAPVIDPSWTSLFGLMGGAIIELGGLLSHGSIALREYGIPAVVNLPNITKILKEGMRVTLDGDKGRVYLLDE